MPILGGRALDTITVSDVQRLKAAFADQAPASVNDILTLLSTVLKAAVADMPPRARILPPSRVPAPGQQLPLDLDLAANEGSRLSPARVPWAAEEFPDESA